MTDLTFRDEVLTPMRRHWVCMTNGCTGEMKATGVGSQMGKTMAWEHRCDKCGHIDRADVQYPYVLMKVSK